jgi:hypothetical protein
MTGLELAPPIRPQSNEPPSVIHEVWWRSIINVVAVLRDPRNAWMTILSNVVGAVLQKHVWVFVLVLLFAAAYADSKWNEFRVFRGLGAAVMHAVSIVYALTSRSSATVEKDANFDKDVYAALCDMWLRSQLPSQPPPPNNNGREKSAARRIVRKRAANGLRVTCA